MKFLKLCVAVSLAVALLCNFQLFAKSTADDELRSHVLYELSQKYKNTKDIRPRAKTRLRNKRVRDNKTKLQKSENKRGEKIKLKIHPHTTRTFYHLSDRKQIEKHMDFIRHYVAKLALKFDSVSDFARRNNMHHVFIKDFLNGAPVSSKGLGSLCRLIGANYEKPLDVTNADVLKVDIWAQHVQHMKSLEEEKKEGRNNSPNTQNLKASGGVKNQISTEGTGTDQENTRTDQEKKTIQDLQKESVIHKQKPEAAVMIDKEGKKTDQDKKTDQATRTDQGKKSIRVLRKERALHRQQNKTTASIDIELQVRIVNAIYDDNLDMLINLFNQNKLEFDHPLSRGNRAVHYAAKYGAFQIMHWLLDRGEEIDVANLEGEGPLYWSILSFEHDMTRYLLARGASPNGVVGYKVRPPLHEAIAMHDLRSVKQLVAHGADVNRTYQSGWNPLKQFSQQSSATKDTAVDEDEKTLSTAGRQDDADEQVADRWALRQEGLLKTETEVSVLAAGLQPPNNTAGAGDTSGVGDTLGGDAASESDDASFERDASASSKAAGISSARRVSIGSRLSKEQKQKIKKLTEMGNLTSLELALKVNAPEIIEFLQQHKAQAREAFFVAYEEYKNIMPEATLATHHLTLKEEYENMSRRQQQKQAAKLLGSSLGGCEFLLSQ